MDKLDMHTLKGRKHPSSDVEISEAQTPKRPKTDCPKKPRLKKSSSSFVTTPSSTTDMDLESNVTTTQNTPLLLQKKQRPAIQASALDWLDEPMLHPPENKGKGCAKTVPDGWEQHIPALVVADYQICPDRIYEHLGKIMTTNRDRGDRLWEMSHRLCLATVYGAKTLGPLAKRKGITGKIQRVVTALLAEERLDVVIREDDPVSVEELNVPAHFSKGGVYKNPRGYKRPREAERTSRVWALVTLPEAMPVSYNMFDIRSFRVQVEYPKEAILLVPFPWELQEDQWFRIGRTPATTRETDVRQAIEDNVGSRQAEVPSVQKSADKGGQIVWNIRLTFKRKTVTNDDGSRDSVVDTLGKSDRQWKVGHDEWLIWPGTHCTGCHGVGHMGGRVTRSPKKRTTGRSRSIVEGDCVRSSHPRYGESHDSPAQRMQLPPTREHILPRRTRAGGRGGADNADREERDIGLMWYNEGECGDEDGKCCAADRMGCLMPPPPSRPMHRRQWHPRASITGKDWESIKGGFEQRVVIWNGIGKG
ncbi:hypothetical protein JB92DRAFT_2827111 [Gautieria morchelliformis]|nr:hypothetical protein JB92DRAFT_2827111 [Gautieria morchelliformis]